jgi:drug/metabolite transporter (DMT)-like permease
MTRPRIALLIGILCISIFPVLVKLDLAPGLISAFYRMAIAFTVLLPYWLLTKQPKIPSLTLWLLTILCGLIFAIDVAVWNISIQESTATQATLLANLAPVWVGVGTFLFLKNKPGRNFWIGTVLALLGMVTLVGFDFFMALSFDRGFGFAVLSGILYAVYIMLSKKVLSKVAISTFMTISLLTSSLFLALVCSFLKEPFTGFSNIGWLVLAIQGLICQLLAWLMISYATRYMKATRVSLSLLSQAILAPILAWLLLKEAIGPQMILGGVILLFGIGITFIEGPVGLPRPLRKKIANSQGGRLPK